MSIVVNGHTIPTSDDIKDTDYNDEWDNLQTNLTALGTAIDADSKLTDGIELAGSIVLAGDITSTTPAVDWDVKDNDATALSIDTAGKSGLIVVDTQTGTEKITMSGGLDVAGTLAAAAAATVGTTLDVTGVTSVSTITTDANIGAVNTGVTAVEYGNGYNHTTVLTISQSAALTLGDNESLADGYLLYTLPAGALFVNSSYMSVNVTNAEHDAEVTDMGLGTVIGTGAIATLTTATMEDIHTGQTGAVGTALPSQALASTSPFALSIETGDDHTVHLNVAGAWADTAGIALDADIAGTVILNWSFLA